MKNLKIYFYAVLAIGVFSCSNNDVEDDIGTNPDDVENIDLRNFLYTIESWTTYPQSSIDWEHQFDSDGLFKSVLYEKYPERVIWEIEYLD